MDYIVGYLWIATWIIFWLIGRKAEYKKKLCNRGIRVIKGEYYRFFTGLLLHCNWFHLLVNVLGMYFTIRFVGGQIATIPLLLFSAAGATLSNIFFSVVYRESESIGGSLVVFVLLGLVCSLQLFCDDARPFTLDSLETQWMLGYAILSNIPLFSKNSSTLVCHVIAFVVGVILGSVCIGLKLMG